MPTNNDLTLDCIMRIMRAEIPHAYFNSPAAGERFARAIESEVLAPTQQPNYCDIHCKKFCQNSVHGMCDGPPAQQQNTEIQTDEEDRWISVNVRTPATADFVIATNMRSITLAQYFQGNWIGMGCVTHWMALPNMPTAASREES
ncbi:hypothetical protein GSH05_09950 [Burkholderia pseudomallei]|uniref:hypothetical protein n=1 Tax=Burkholderia pseudomallei TaxID=28450 RepID=UPI0005382415|nr:hypothetical protein [Burkholderia pseudomallei]KGW26932.1 hypothetical protein Y602_1999 [Burkholderia pseudomallei MSHR733]MBM5651977.1 hypothetical protein [Burkholderia pseudomallei]